MSVVAPTPRVALILDLHNHIHRGVMEGVCAYARRHGPWRFVWVQRNSALPRPEWARLRPDGVIAAGLDAREAEALAAAGVAAVGLNDRAAGVDLPVVVKDHARAGALGAEHLLERGLRCLAFCGHEALGYSRATATGFLAAVAAAGGRGHEMTLRFPMVADWSWETHGPELLDWLEALPRPAGVLACNDYFARQLVAAAEALGRRVPEELAVVGINDNPIECQLSPVPISSVALAADRIGWEACRLLQGGMEHRSGLPAEVRVPPRAVVVRASSDVFAVEDPAVARAMRRIHEQAGRAIGVADLVRGLGLSRRAFEVRFRRSLGRSPYGEIIRQRIDRARRLLLDTDLSIGVIAAECGFGEAKVLHRHFRKLAGTTPAAFRGEWGRHRFAAH